MSVNIKYTSDGSGQMFCATKRNNPRTVWNTEPYTRHATCIHAIVGLLKDCGGKTIRVNDYVKGATYLLSVNGKKTIQIKLKKQNISDFPVGSYLNPEVRPPAAIIGN